MTFRTMTMMNLMNFKTNHLTLQAIALMEKEISHITLQPWHLYQQRLPSITWPIHQLKSTSKIQLLHRQRLASYPPADMGIPTPTTLIFDVSTLCNHSKDIPRNVHDTLHSLALLASMTQTTETAY